jgi:hypothetical protein
MQICSYQVKLKFDPMRTLVVFLIAFLTHGSLMAVTATWVGGSGEWNDLQHWDTGQVPGAGDDAVIPASNITVEIPANLTVYISSIEVGEDVVLSVLGGISLKTSNTYGIWCKGQVDFASGAYLEASGDMYNTTGILVESGTLVIYEDAELWLNYFENGISVSYGHFFNFGKIQVKYIRPNFSAINFESQGVGYNFPTGSIQVKNMNATGLNLLTDTDRFYNYGLITALNGMEGRLIQTIGSAQFLNYKSGEVIIHSSGVYAINNSGEIYNWGNIEIFSGGYFQNWSGLFHNLTSGHLSINDLDGIDSRGLTLDGLIAPSSVINEGNIAITAIGSGTSAVSVLAGSDFTNAPSGNLTFSFMDNNSGLSIFDGEFYNEGGRLTFTGDPAGVAFRVFSSGRLLNKNCGDIHILAGEIDINQGLFQNDAWVYLNHPDTDITTFGNSTLINYGLMIDPHYLLSGVSGFENEGLVFDRLDPDPVYPGVPIQDALTIGDFGEVSSISWHLSENGPLAGEFSNSTNQLFLFKKSIGAQTLWLNFDFYLGNCGNVWVQLPVEGGVQAPPPPPLQESSANQQQSAEWKVYPNPADDQLEIMVGAESSQMLRIQLLNELGQTVFESLDSSQKGTVLTLNRPAQLASGWYLLRIIGERELLFSEKVIWQ